MVACGGGRKVSYNPTEQEQEMDVAAKKYMVCLEGDESTNYSAYVPDLSGCVAATKTCEERLKLMAEAMWLHIENMSVKDNDVRTPLSTTNDEDAKNWLMHANGTQE
jgi:predicted RNase H-like HicB family nuclease